MAETDAPTARGGDQRNGMFDAWIIVLFAFAYIGVLFAIAWAGDVVMKRQRVGPGGRPFIYGLSIGVYCTTWTFFGSVGRATATGWDFLAVYIGPCLLYTSPSPRDRS